MIASVEGASPAVRVIGENKLHNFAKKHANARAAICNWLDVVQKAQWSKHTDVTATFASADYVKPWYVFNIGGNNYRVIAVVEFVGDTLYIRHVMTHAEYDKWKP